MTEQKNKNTKKHPGKSKERITRGEWFVYNCVTNVCTMVERSIFDSIKGALGSSKINKIRKQFPAEVGEMVRYNQEPDYFRKLKDKIARLSKKKVTAKKQHSRRFTDQLDEASDDFKRYQNGEIPLRHVKVGKDGTRREWFQYSDGRRITVEQHRKLFPQPKKQRKENRDAKVRDR